MPARAHDSATDFVKWEFEFWRPVGRIDIDEYRARRQLAGLSVQFMPVPADSLLRHEQRHAVRPARQRLIANIAYRPAQQRLLSAAVFIALEQSAYTGLQRLLLLWATIVSPGQKGMHQYNYGLGSRSPLHPERKGNSDPAMVRRRIATPDRRQLSGSSGVVGAFFIFLRLCITNPDVVFFHERLEIAALHSRLLGAPRHVPAVSL